MSRSLLLLSTVFSVSISSVAQGAEIFLDPIFSVQTTYNVQYGSALAGIALPDYGIIPASGPYQMPLMADIYRPQGANLPSQLPAVLLIHEGGFVTGDKSDNDIVVVATSLASRGYVVMNMNYRLIPDGIPDEINTLASNLDLLAVYQDQAFQGLRAQGFAAAINDSKQATQWLLANADSLDINTDKMLVGGISSGARVALADGLFEMPDQFAGVISLLGALDNNESLITSSQNAPAVYSLYMYSGTQDSLIDPVAAQNLATATSTAGIPTLFQSVNSEHDISLLMQPNSEGTSPWDQGMEFIYDQLELGTLVTGSSSVPEASSLLLLSAPALGFCLRFTMRRFKSSSSKGCCSLPGRSGTIS
jgi:predicted esterase